MPSVYEIVTEKILHELESGKIPWEMPFAVEQPKNLCSGKPYRGINTLLLGMSKFSSPYWLTYKQAAERGGNVRKGEHGTLIVFWKWNQNPTHTADTETECESTEHRAPLLRYYTVFNVEQCDKIEAPAPRPAVPSIEKADSIVAGYHNPPTVETGSQASYLITSDVVTMPARSAFEQSEEYYSVFFHELTHSTRHSSRLDRGTGVPNRHGSEEYSKEELVAEMGAAMLCAMCGIHSTIRRSAGYIQNWMQVLKNDARMVVLAASQAQKAADWILGPSQDESEHDATTENVPFCGE